MIVSAVLAYLRPAVSSRSSCESRACPGAPAHAYTQTPSGSSGGEGRGRRLASDAKGLPHHPQGVRRPRRASTVGERGRVAAELAAELVRRGRLCAGVDEDHHPDLARRSHPRLDALAVMGRTQRPRLP